MKTNFSFQQCRGVAFPSSGKKHVDSCYRAIWLSFWEGRLTCSTGAHCVGRMCILRADFFFFSFFSGPFSRQWSEKLPLSFSAASLTSSPVCLRAICNTSPLFIQQTLATDTVPTNRLTPRVVQSWRPHPCVSNRERLLKFKQLHCVCLWKNILIDPWAVTLNACWYMWRHALKGFLLPSFYVWHASRSIKWSIQLWQRNQKSVAALTQWKSLSKKFFFVAWFN